MPVQVHSAQGIPFIRQISVGMPKLGKKILKSVFYLYKNRQDAEKGENFGGTGFIVGIESEVQKNSHYLYAVTNWHVALKGNSVIRVNLKDGGVDIFELAPDDWHFIPQKDDIAITSSFPLNSKIHDYTHIPTSLFCTNEKYDELEVGPGDDVFMVGRFINHDGKETNVPAVRFGNISVNPSQIMQPTKYMGDSYIIDLHSRSGFSGSPVFFFRTPANNLDAGSNITISSSILLLLGLHWGQFPEYMPLEEVKDMTAAEQNSFITDGKNVKGLSGMTCVIPAWILLDFLNRPEFKKQREEHDMKIRAEHIKNGPPAEAESASNDLPEISGDQILETMLNTPPETHEEMKDK